MTTLRSRARMLASLGATVAVAASSLVLATPASAAATWSGVASTIIVGVPQTVSVTGIDQGSTEDNSCTSTSAQFQPVINGVNQPVINAPVAQGTAVFQWTPMVTGSASITMAASVGGCSASPLTGITVNSTATTSTVSAPNNVRVGVATQITVTVQSAAPSTYQPTGQVVVKDINGATLATMGLTRSSTPGQSFAYWWWTPPSAGSYTFQATYGGDSFATGSTSPQDVTIASPSGNPIALSLPPTLQAGVPNTLKANVFPSTLQGSVGFTLNGQPISASIPIVNGTATFQWTPPASAAGTQTIGASFTTNQGGSGSTSQQIAITAAPSVADQITLNQPGYGTWVPNGTFRIPNGTTVTFTASSLSGSPVTLSETGPCQVNGLTLVVDTPNAQCNLVASTAGGNGYAPARVGYTVLTGVGQQTANVNPPISGRVNKGRAIVLEGPGQGDTNAGQNIVWRVQKGSKSVCRLGFPADGSVTVKLTKSGQCTVVGSAPGVPGQWSPYRISRTYRA